MKKPFKLALGCLLIFPFIFPIHAEVNFVKKGGVSFECYKHTGATAPLGKDEHISWHRDEVEAVQCVLNQQLADPECSDDGGERCYRWKGIGYGTITISSDAQAQLVEGILDDDSPGSVGGPPQSAWTCVEIGAGTGCDTFTDTGGTLSVTCAGVDQDNGCFIYQSMADGDIQLTYRISASSDFSGGDATGVGPYVSGMIRNGATGGNPFAHLRWRDNIDRHVGAYRILQDGSPTGGLFGATGFTVPIYGGGTYDDSADAVAMWESDAASADPATDYLEIASGINMQGGFAGSLNAGVFCASNHATNTVDCVVDDVDLSSTISLVGGTPPAPPVDRSGITVNLDWETGDLQQRDFTVNGVVTDAAWVKQITAAGTCSVTSVNNSSSASATISGCAAAPACIGSAPHPTYLAITFPVVSSGMTQLSRRMFRVCDAGGGSFQLWQDGVNATGLQDGNETLGDSRVNASGWGTFSGGPYTVTYWQQEAFINGGMTDAALGVKIVQTITPPTNVNGTATDIDPLVGDYMMCADLSLHRDHSKFTGNNNKNKPRYGLIPGTGFSDQVAPSIAYNTEAWGGFMAAIPSNWESNDPSLGSNQSQMHFFQIADDAGVGLGGGGSGILIISIEKHSSGTDHYYADIARNSGNLKIDLGAVEPGEWTQFLWQVRTHVTTGIVNIWKSIGGCNSAVDCSMSQVVNVTGGFGVTSGDEVSPQDRLYKHGWAEHPGTGDGPELMVCKDAYFWGLTSNGVDDTKVSAFGQSVP